MQAITWIAAYAIMPLVTFGAFSLSKTLVTLLGLHGIKPPIESICLCSGSIPEYTQGNLESGSERWWRCAECMRADAAYPDKNMSTEQALPDFFFIPSRTLVIQKGGQFLCHQLPVSSPLLEVRNDPGIGQLLPE